MKTRCIKTALIFLTILCIFHMVSCARDSQEKVDSAQNASEADSGSETPTETQQEDEDWRDNSSIPAKKYGGREVKFISYDYEPGNFKSYLTEVYAEEMTGAVVNDAVFLRNSEIEEKFQVKISEYKTPKLVDEVTKLVLAGSDEYDFVFTHIMDQFVLAIKGSLIDMNNIPTLNYDNFYYLKSVMNDISIGHRNYMTITDFNMQAYNGAEILYFNKKLVENYQLTSPYELVKSGKWTLDTFTELCTAVSADLAETACMMKMTVTESQRTTSYGSRFSMAPTACSSSKMKMTFPL